MFIDVQIRLNNVVNIQIFVANPEKPRPIQEILLRNRDKLVEFLTKFHTDRSEDEQFNDEKAYLIKQIKDLKRSLEPLPPAPAASPPAATGTAATAVKPAPSEHTGTAAEKTS